MITFFFKEALVFYLAPHLSFITDHHLETDLNIHCFSGEWVGQSVFSQSVSPSDSQSVGPSVHSIRQSVSP